MHPHLAQATKVAKLLDSQFGIGSFRFGIDGLIGLIPGIGDALTLAFSLYLLWVGWQMRVPPAALVQMILNIGVDTLLGAVPIVGDLADILYKANLRNLAILQKHDIGEVVEGEVVQRESKATEIRN